MQFTKANKVSFNRQYFPNHYFKDFQRIYSFYTMYNDSKIHTYLNLLTKHEQLRAQQSEDLLILTNRIIW